MIADFTWGNLDNFNLKEEFRDNAQQRLDDLKKDATPPSSRGVYKVLACLSNKHTKKIDDNTLTDFFKQIESTLPNDMPYMVDMSRPLTSDKFTGKRKSTILQGLCFKAIKNAKPQLATQILQLISEPILGTEKKDGASLHLALFALKKGKGFVPLVKEILKKIPRERGLVQTYVNQVNVQGESLLILAAKLELDDFIKYLINQGADGDLVEIEGETALSIGIKKILSTKSLRKIISHMKDFKYLDKDGNNYLHLAVQKGLPEIIAPLLASPSLEIYAQNKEGKSVLELAFAGGYQEVAKELIKHTPSNATARHYNPLLSIATRHYLPLAIEKKWEDVAIELFRKRTVDFYEKQSPQEIFNHYKRALENNLHQFAEIYFAELFTSNSMNDIPTDSRYLTEALAKGSSKLIQEFLLPNRQVLPVGSEAQLLEGIVRFHPSESFSTLIQALFNKIGFIKISNYLTCIKNFSTEVQQEIARVIFQFWGFSNRQDLLISSIDADWDFIIPFLIEKGAIIDDKNDSAFHHALLKQSEPITRLFLSVLLPNKEDQLSPEMLDSQAKPDITPKSLAWFFKTFVTNPEWKDHMSKVSPESIFEQLLDSAYANEHVLDQEVFRSAASLPNYNAILKDFAQKCLDAVRLKNRTPSDLINYIGGMAPLNEYLDGPMQQYFLDIFGPLSANKDLTHSQAKTLAKLFPNCTLSIQFLDLDQPLEGFNRFILNSSPYLRMLISRECNDQSKILSLTEIPSSYFKIIYNFLSERRLETSTLNEESKIELESILKLYRGSPPDQKEMKSHDSIITEFLKDPYISDCTELQIDASTMTLDHAVLKEYFSYFPNLIMIKCDGDVLDKSPLFWELLIKTLPNFKRVEVTFQKPSSQFRLPPSLTNHLFLFKGLNHADSSLLTAIQQCHVGGLDFSNQSRFDLSLDTFLLQKKIQYLNFSNTDITKEQLIPILQATPELREINLENCQHLTDPELLDIGKICPLLEKIYLSHVSDAVLEKTLSQNKGLTFYVGKKRVEGQSSVIRELKLEQMIELVQDAYLLESDALFILNAFLENLSLTDNISFRDALIELLTMIKGKESNTAHPLISFTQQLKKKQLKDFYASLADKLQGHTLDEYLNSNDLNKFYKILAKFITKTKPTIRRVRILSNLFSPKAIPLIPLSIGRDPDAPKRPATPYPIHPLILLSAGKKLKEICESPKIYSLSEIVLHYIHAYLQEGKTNLKRIGLDSLLEIVEEFEKVGLSVRNFLQAAADKQVNIKLSRSTPASIAALLNLLNPKAIEYITGVDLVKSKLKITDIADLMKKAKKLKTIRIPAQPIPEDSWKELIAKGMLVTLVFNDPKEFKAFNFPRAELFNRSDSRIHLELGDQVRALSLAEYLGIIQSIPALNNIDLSDFELCKGSDELNELIKICKVHPKILDLGNCETLDKEDLKKIAKSCEGLKEFRCSHKNPDLIKQIFSKHAFDICEIKQIEVKEASKENLPTVDLTGFVEVDVQSVIDACNTESPMVLNLGDFVFQKQEIESIAKACPNLLVLFCSKNYSFNVLEIFQKTSPGVSYGQ